MIVIATSSLMLGAGNDFANATISEENFNLDYVASYQRFDLLAAMEKIGYDGRFFVLLDWSADERLVLLGAHDRPSDVHSVVALNILGDDEPLLEYSFTLPEVLASFNHTDQHATLYQARFSPEDIGVVYLTIRYLDSSDGSDPVGTAETYRMDIFGFNQTDRTSQAVYSGHIEEELPWFDFGPPGKLFVSDSSGAWLIGLNDGTRESIQLPTEFLRPEDVSTDGMKLLEIEPQNRIVVFDMIANATTHEFQAVTGKNSEKFGIVQARFATNDYVIYSGGFRNDEPRAPFLPSMIGVQSMEDEDPVYYEIVTPFFPLGNYLLNPNGTSLLVAVQYGETTFKLDLIHPIPEFHWAAIIIAFTAITTIVVWLRYISRSGFRPHHIA
jgi:hypothetical protein